MEPDFVQKDGHMTLFIMVIICKEPECPTIKEDAARGKKKKCRKETQPKIPQTRRGWNSGPECSQSQPLG
jgi:hypothetical protein